MFLEYGIISLAFYEPTPYKKLIVEINNQRDKFESTHKRELFVTEYKKVFLAQRKKLKKILSNIADRTITIYPEPTRDEMMLFLKQSWIYNDAISIVVSRNF